LYRANINVFFKIANHKTNTNHPKCSNFKNLGRFMLILNAPFIAFFYKMKEIHPLSIKRLLEHFSSKNALEPRKTYAVAANFPAFNTSCQARKPSQLPTEAKAA
jgi:hypothetical protein